MSYFTVAAMAMLVFAFSPAWAQPAPGPGGVQFYTVSTSRSYLGVGVKEVGDANRARELKLSEEGGVEVTKVDDESPALRAGIQVNDVVLEYNGQRIEGDEQFVRLVRETPVGRAVKLKISRSGSTKWLTATIGQRKTPVVARRFEIPDGQVFVAPPGARPDMPNPFLLWRSGMLGIEAEGLEPELAEYFGVKEGVLVRRVVKDSAAAKAGLKAGDVILKVEETRVTTPREVTTAIHSSKSKKPLQLKLMRHRQEMAVAVTLEDDPPEWPKARAVTAPQ